MKLTKIGKNDHFRIKIAFLADKGYVKVRWLLLIRLLMGIRSNEFSIFTRKYLFY